MGKRLAAPTVEQPTTGCWTPQTIERLFREILLDLRAHGFRTAPTHIDLHSWLSSINLEHTIEADGQLFHVLDLGASSQLAPDPFEMLMAAMPSGVVCYFAAVAFHELTTQIAEHYHIAELVESAPPALRLPKASPATPKQPARRTSTESPRSLGRLLFRFEGTPYYWSKRVSRLVPGVQARLHGPKTLLRIATLDQTLLDCLYKPRACGGPEVVFEAWTEAHQLERLDEERLSEYLSNMHYPSAVRRVGAMFKILGRTAGKDLRESIETTCAQIDRQSPFAEISLLPGFDFPNLDHESSVRIP